MPDSVRMPMMVASVFTWIVTEEPLFEVTWAFVRVPVVPWMAVTATFGVEPNVVPNVSVQFPLASVVHEPLCTDVMVGLSDRSLYEPLVATVDSPLSFVTIAALMRPAVDEAINGVVVPLFPKNVRGLNPCPDNE